MLTATTLPEFSKKAQTRLRRDSELAAEKRARPKMRPFPSASIVKAEESQGAGESRTEC